jgi:hypothetical protein
MKEFVTAAKDGFGEVDDEDAIVFKHDDREVTFFKPATGQMAIMMAMAGRDMGSKEAGQFINLFFSLMDDDTSRYFESRLMDRKDPFDLDSEGGIFDIWYELGEEWSARPTKKPADYQPPRRATGKPSTAPTRAKVSTSSKRRSTASSQ